MIRLALRVPAEHAELVLAELLDLAPAGVEEVQLPAGGERAGGDTAGAASSAGRVVEYAVYGAAGELPELPDLQAAVGGVQIEVSTSEVADDWSERWKQFHRPVLVGGRLHVRPPWAPPTDADGVHEIVIDPGQAFGTGAHATTHLCLELMLDVARTDSTRGPVLDVGAGSGVLSIAAAKLGYTPVLALDYDPRSIAAAHENAAANGVQLEVCRFDLRHEPLPGGYPVVLANLLLPLLLALAESMDAAPRHLIASGLLREQAGEVAAAFAERLSLRERARRERGEWAALWLAP